MPTATQLSSCKMEWRGYLSSLRYYTPKPGEQTVSIEEDRRAAKSKGKAKSKKSVTDPVVESQVFSLDKLTERYDDISRTVPVELCGSVAAVLECMLYAVDEGDDTFTPPPAPAVAKAAAKRRGGSRGGNKVASRAETPLRTNTPLAKQQIKAVSQSTGDAVPAKASSISPQSHWELAGETFDDGDQLGELVR